MLQRGDYYNRQRCTNQGVGRGGIISKRPHYIDSTKEQAECCDNQLPKG